MPCQKWDSHQLVLVWKAPSSPPEGHSRSRPAGCCICGNSLPPKPEMVGEGWQSVSLEALSPYWTQKKPANMSAALWHFPYETSWWWSVLHDMGLVREPWGTETIDPDNQLVLAVRGRRTSPAAVVPFWAAGWVGYWLLCTLSWSCGMGRLGQSLTVKREKGNHCSRVESECRAAERVQCEILPRPVLGMKRKNPFIYTM